MIYPAAIPIITDLSAQAGFQLGEFTKWAALLITFVLALIVLTVVSSAISAVLRSPALRSIDKGLGFLFGALRGLLLLALLWLLIEYIQPSLLASEAVVTSRGAGLVRETSTAIFEAMPWNFFEQLIADFFSDAPKPAPGFENLPTSNPPANDTL